MLIGISFALYALSAVYLRCMPADCFPWGSAALPWHLEYIPEAMFYMALGYAFRREGEARFDRVPAPWIAVVAWIVYLTLVSVLPALGNPLPMPRVVRVFLFKMTGLVAIVSLCKLLRPNRYMLYVGQNTLIFFALHGKVYGLGQYLLRRLCPRFYGKILSELWLSVAFEVVFALLISLILLLPAWIINRWFPFLLGRKRPPKRESNQANGL